MARQLRKRSCLECTARTVGLSDYSPAMIMEIKLLDFFDGTRTESCAWAARDR